MTRALPTPVVPALGRTDLLDRPGAFEWWYADLLDGEGNGVVLIASFGLPMIPLALAARRKVPPRDLPALAFSVYRAGRPHHWAFQTFQPGEAGWDGDRRWFASHEVKLHIGPDEATLNATLNGTTGRAPFHGTIRVTGPLRTPSAGEPAAAEHAWSLLSASATGTADLVIEGRPFRVEGSGYLDRNEGESPLSDLGVATWHWGRVAFPSGTLVWYAAEGAGAAHRVWWVTPEGGVQPITGEPTEHGRTVSTYLLTHPASLGIPGPHGAITVPLDGVVEDGPFYRRFQLRLDVPGLGRGLGYAEWATQRAMDDSPLLPLVRMAVDQGPGSSMWLPLLVGPPDTRWSRFLRGQK